VTWQGRALVVEDDPETANLLAATMRQIGFTPLVAADGYEALAMTRPGDGWIPGFDPPEARCCDTDDSRHHGFGSRG
jgi:CheY-like chemotaxis protein